MDKQRSTICLIAGTRPEVIKLAPVYFSLLESQSLKPYWLSTGQHKEMTDQALSAFSIIPDEDLALMESNQSLTDLTARTLKAVGDSLERLRPQAVLLQGDTTTVLASALASFYQSIPIGHVEAGLRTYQMNSPWPEEMNRRLVAPLSRWCFAPTATAMSNLSSERIDPSCCHLTGNTVVDALLWMREKLSASLESPITRAVRLGIPKEFAAQHLLSVPSQMILLTLHRRESFDTGIERVCIAVERLLKENPDSAVVCPMHLNILARGPILRILDGNPQVALIEPISYEDFIWLMIKSRFIISDSGGIQEEAPSLGKPVLVVRESSERMEGVAAGTCKVVGTDLETILHETSLLLGNESEYRTRSTLANPYGDGGAAQKIHNILQAEIAFM